MLSGRSYLYRLKSESYVVDVSQRLQFYGWSPDMVIDCSLGINPYGCSPQVLTAFHETEDSDVLNRYPDAWGKTLKKDLAVYWQSSNVEVEDIVLGTGSIGILERLNKMLLFPGARILGYAPQFTGYISDARAAGAIYEWVPLLLKDKLRFDYKSFLEAMNNNGPYNLIYLDNPNNPTGQQLLPSELYAIISRAAEMGVPVVVDEAYGDFIDPEASAVHLLNKFSNIAVVRSFSKGLGLAGLRVGYAFLSKELRTLYSKVEKPFGVTEMGIKLCKVALRDKKFVNDSCKKVKEVKAEILERLHVLQVFATAPTTPIMVLNIPSTDIDLFDVFLRQGVIVVSGSNIPGLKSNSVRLRVPVPEETDTLIKRLARVEKDILNV